MKPFAVIIFIIFFGITPSLGQSAEQHHEWETGCDTDPVTYETQCWALVVGEPVKGYSSVPMVRVVIYNDNVVGMRFGSYSKTLTVQIDGQEADEFDEGILFENSVKRLIRKMLAGKMGRARVGKDKEFLFNLFGFAEAWKKTVASTGSIPRFQ